MIPLRPEIKVQGTFRQQTWECRHGNSGREGSSCGQYTPEHVRSVAYLALQVKEEECRRHVVSIVRKSGEGRCVDGYSLSASHFALDN